MATAVDSPACPECGRTMLRRTATKGSRMGLDLWRCVDRNCPGIINIDPEQAIRPPAAGESAQARFERERALQSERLRRGAPLIASVSVLIGFVAFFAVHPFGGPHLAAGVAIFVLAGSMYVIFKLPSDVVNWQRGAEARSGASA